MASTVESTSDVQGGDAAAPDGGTGRSTSAPGRVASVLGAGTLAYYGYRRRDLTGIGLAVLGGALLARGAAASSRSAPPLKKQHGRAAVLDASDAVKVEHSVTILQPVDVLYRFWRDFENLPRIMDHLESVTVTSPERSHWRAKAPAGTSVEWDAVVHNEVENELIAWKSAEGADVKHAGSVHFTPASGGRGTEVRVVLEYEPPAGKLGVAVAKLLGEDPDTQVREDLRRFKRVMESGEVLTVEGQPSGRGR
jgi:uncharacterized membrane protein